jgi:metal-responsive CopG/Arc/MetJ family transcriptional regulator
MNMSRAKVMISIPEEFLAEIDKAATEENRSRSEFLREAARLYLEIRKNPVTPGQDPRVQKAIAIQDMLAHQDTLPEWNSTVEIRRWRENR